MKSLKKGFTLLEMVIVVAIIGILSYFIAPKILLQIRKATVANVKHNLGVIRESLEFDANLESEFPDLIHENGKDNSRILEKYRVYETPAFVDSNGIHYHETARVFDERTNTGGWYYIREEGIIFANLPNGAYTKDPLYEVWEEEEGTNVAETTETTIDWDNNTKGGSYFVGAGGQVYEYPTNSNKYVVDVRPNVGWLDNFEKNSKLSGNYFIYIDDKLAYTGYAEPSSNGQSISAPNRKQDVGQKDAKNIKVGFEYTNSIGETKLIYGEMDLN